MNLKGWQNVTIPVKNYVQPGAGSAYRHGHATNIRTAKSRRHSI